MMPFQMYCSVLTVLVIGVPKLDFCAGGWGDIQAQGLRLLVVCWSSHTCIQLCSAKMHPTPTHVVWGTPPTPEYDTPSVAMCGNGRQHWPVNTNGCGVILGMMRPISHHAKSSEVMAGTLEVAKARLWEPYLRWLSIKDPHLVASLPLKSPGAALVCWGLETSNRSFSHPV